ncbi:hypothetical protein PALB_13350 [Pseudoalteromonas luteoviolacea B = ATCC 29581]|nr:hypothetical protein PALB_13350 [Pseudoalteromonas luteoviolacea B = ATCC 29581]
MTKQGDELRNQTNRPLFFLWVLSALSIVSSVSGAFSELGSVLKISAMLGLCLFAINNWLSVRKDNDDTLTAIAGLTSLALLFSVVGDVINLNLLDQFYGYSLIIKHDYLADSVWFFAPAYAAFMVACWLWLRVYKIGYWYFALSLVGGGVLGSLSYLSMMRTGTSGYVLYMTFFYAAFITLPTVFAFWFMYVATKHPVKKPLFSIAIGLILATVADALIGQFWLFGNDGQGYYPLIREVNWLVYFSSQALLVQLPRCFNQAKKTVTIR